MLVISDGYVMREVPPRNREKESSCEPALVDEKRGDEGRRG